jgi:hypothetical protein
LLVARWVPLIVPLAGYGLDRAGLHYSPVYFLLTAGSLLLSARTWMEIGSGLGILVPVQLLAGATATVLLAGNFLDPTAWLFYASATALMTGYVAWFFNLLGSLLPR